jgi:hypothetical protein
VSNHPDLAKKYGYEEAEGGAAAAEAGAAEGGEKKGGGGKKKGGLKEVTIAQKSRQKNKFICLVRGLEKFGASPALFPCLDVIRQGHSTARATHRTAQEQRTATATRVQ